MDQRFYDKLLKSLKEHNVSIEAIKKDIIKKEKYRLGQLAYNKKKYNFFNRRV